jgi:hypothetical protein
MVKYLRELIVWNKNQTKDEKIKIKIKKRKKAKTMKKSVKEKNLLKD